MYESAQLFNKNGNIFRLEKYGNGNLLMQRI